MKLGLGTAQFGLAYGVNQAPLPPSEIKNILNLAKKANMKVLDTAHAYGGAETQLGLNDMVDFKVISKLSSLQMEDSLRNSLNKLKLKKLYALLLHRPLDLLSTNGKLIYDTLKHFKAQGLIEKMGISIYSYTELEAIFPAYHFDVVQAPFNLFDQTLLTSGWLSKLSKLGVEIHARSVFLQGVLLHSHLQSQAYFSPWAKHFKKYQNWLEKKGLDPLTACLAFVLQQPAIDQVIVGVDSERHLQAILQASKVTTILEETAMLQMDDINLIHPTRWQVKTISQEN